MMMPRDYPIFEVGNRSNRGISHEFEDVVPRNEEQKGKGVSIGTDSPLKQEAHASTDV
jgi:hypothetical protein